LKITKPANTFSTNTHFASEIGNVRSHLGLPRLADMSSALSLRFLRALRHFQQAFERRFET
jgi:hypothetical protein